MATAWSSGLPAWYSFLTFSLNALAEADFLSGMVIWLKVRWDYTGYFRFCRNLDTSFAFVLTIASCNALASSASNVAPDFTLFTREFAAALPMPYFSKANAATSGLDATSQAIAPIGHPVEAPAHVAVRYRNTFPVFTESASLASSNALSARTFDPIHGTACSSLSSLASFHFPTIFATREIASSRIFPEASYISFSTLSRNSRCGAYTASSSLSHGIRAFAMSSSFMRISATMRFHALLTPESHPISESSF